MGAVGGGSSESSSRDNPAEHVGTHIGGIAGCRACGGSGGIAGHTSGVDGGETLLQATVSVESIASIQCRGEVESIGFMVSGSLGGVDLDVLGARHLNGLVVLGDVRGLVCPSTDRALAGGEPCERADRRSHSHRTGDELELRR